MLGSGGSQFKFSEANSYVPIRPLKDQRNLLFTVGQPQSLPFFIRLLASTPALGFTLEGLINDWSPGVIGGALIGTFFAVRLMNYLNFFKAHEIYQLAVNKSLTSFEFTLPKNKFSQQWEDMLLKSKKLTYQQHFLQKLKDGTLNYPAE